MDKANATKRTDLFLIDPRNIVVVDGFNVRQDFDLEELKEAIKDKGVLNPITVIPFRDEDGVERYKLVDGERRYRATMLAIQEGADIQYIKALKAPRDSSAEELHIQQMMRNEGKRFTEYECAIMYKRFKDVFGYSQVQIAKVFHKSTAAVCKCLSLLELPEYIQRKIATGQMSVMVAREIVQNFDTEAEQVEVARQAIHQAKELGKKSVTTRQINKTLEATREARQVTASLRKILGHLEGCYCRSDIQNLVDALEETGDLDKAVSLYKTRSEQEMNAMLAEELIELQTV